MTRVFEALQREQKNRKKEKGRAPLEAETGAPEDERGTDSDAAASDAAASDAAASDAAASDAAATEFEFLSGIGSPVGRRSDEGLMAPGLSNLARDFNGESAAGETTDHRAVTRPPREIPIERLVTTRLHQRLIMLTCPTAAECERYRTLSARLFHAAEKRETQVVVITSALAGEGKTSTALNLALAMAQSKENRVLIVDGNLSRPNIASYLGMRPGAGLSEVLKGEIDVLDSIVCVEEPELYVAPVSHEAANGAELLSSKRFAEAISELRDYFDFILIDSPPLETFADSRLLSDHSDAVILVIRAGKTPYKTVEKAVEILPAGRVLGVVLNGAEDV